MPDLNGIGIDTKNSVSVVNLSKLSSDEESVQGVDNTSTLKTKTSEDDLVEFEDTETTQTGGKKRSELDVLQERRERTLERYFRYQSKIADLQERKAKYEAKAEKNKSNGSNGKSYQNKISNITSYISEYSSKCSELEGVLNSIATSITEYIQKQLNENKTQTNSGLSNTNYSTAAAEGANPSTSSLTSSSKLNSANYTGESISKDVASALDNKLGNGFSAKCEKVAAYIGCNVNDFLAMMYSESGINPKARNKSSNAIGLVQFMPSVLSANGYSTAQVANMSAIEQLDVVADIYMKSKKMAGYSENQKLDGGTLYAINWLPAYAKKDTIVSNGGKYYSSGLDMDKDGAVTKADLSKRLQNKYNEMVRSL